jgi:hypothetical protein
MNRMQDERERFLNFLDMLDGGGKGQAGDTFEGGPLSGLLNMLGVRPAGYEARQNEPTAPTMRPMGSMEFTPPIETRRPDGIGATPATAYTGPAVAPNPTPASTYDDAYMSYLRNQLTPQNAYDDASTYYAPMQMVPGVMPAQVTTEDYLNAARQLLNTGNRQDLELLNYLYGTRR